MMALGFLGWRLITANFATVEPGRIYRSGQMNGRTLGSVLRDKDIKTVLNLRGANPAWLWYRHERAIVLGAGATQVDVAMSSCEWMSRAQLQAVIQVLDSAEYPILIHCQHGSERTSLVSAFCELLRPGGSLERARGQFSVAYLFVPVKDGAVMLDHLEQYAGWLEGQRIEHSPDQFRRWVAEGFKPHPPSREDWPYDPYPLVVVTRPAPLEHEASLAKAKEPGPVR
jgi:protein tyrosine phosphatase (PTP) superfamily phosphohydrolase (DUF442 family)